MVQSGIRCIRDKKNLKQSNGKNTPMNASENKRRPDSTNKNHKNKSARFDVKQLAKKQLTSSGASWNQVSTISFALFLWFIRVVLIPITKSGNVLEVWSLFRFWNKPDGWKDHKIMQTFHIRENLQSMGWITAQKILK